LGEDDNPSSPIGRGWKSTFLTKDKSIAEERFVVSNLNINVSWFCLEILLQKNERCLLALLCKVFSEKYWADNINLHFAYLILPLLLDVKHNWVN
ncbi:hypothetical protein ACSFB5_12290, partial [Glaesserella parasuis]|uniref:hypothetical protein n=1 Tax=Glaesserella parasuis TaxID=738 RepID=UPI003F3A1C67